MEKLQLLQKEEMRKKRTEKEREKAKHPLVPRTVKQLHDFWNTLQNENQKEQKNSQPNTRPKSQKKGKQKC